MKNASMKRFDLDKALEAAQRDADKLEPWKVAFIQQCDQQYRTLAGKEPMPRRKKESRFAKCRRLRKARLTAWIERVISELEAIKREMT